MVGEDDYTATLILCQTVIRPRWQELCGDMLTELEVFNTEDLFQKARQACIGAAEKGANFDI